MAAAWLFIRLFGIRKIGWPADVLVLFEGRNDLLLSVDVIAQRDQVHSCLAKLAVIFRGQARAVGGILGVGNHQLDPLSGNKHRQRPLHERHARLADNIAKEQDAHSNTAIRSAEC